mgnify:CR=1 FL=1
MQNSKTLELTQRLIARPSVTPDDAGCQDIIRQELSNLGFSFTDLSLLSHADTYAMEAIKML